MPCDGAFPAREMHSMLALGADYPCKARDRVFVSGAGLATNAYSCDRALFWRTICFLTVSSPTNCSKSFQEKSDYYPLKVSRSYSLTRHHNGDNGLIWF